jgi:hypothetical protein
MSRRLIWILWMTLAAVWFGTLDQRALVRPDEGAMRKSRAKWRPAAIG